jgi:glycosyltransferase involved in cell wall biosynthesis
MLVTAVNTRTGVPGSQQLPPVATVAFVLEQTLGHVTHSANLQALIPAIGRVDARFVPIAFDPGRRHVPGWSNWTVRAGVRAGRSMRALTRSEPTLELDAMFVHTQVLAVLLGTWMRRVPTIVSLDATPVQYDALGEFYGHAAAAAPVERLKHRFNRRSLERAAHVVTWSDWARRSVIEDYRIAAGDVTTIAPGVDLSRWGRIPAERRSSDPVRILFVGGDLDRKGGYLLLEAVRQLRSESELPDVELHLVSGARIDSEPGVVVHSALTPNSPELIAQYHAADIFCLPTRGDCLPMVLAEAAAASLPLVSTDVGAISEIVTPATGVLVAPDDGRALVAALRNLAADPELRRTRGASARRLAERAHDADANARRLVELLIAVSA